MSNAEKRQEARKLANKITDLVIAECSDYAECSDGDVAGEAMQLALHSLFGVEFMKRLFGIPVSY
jgi:hypothetical protein